MPLSVRQELLEQLGKLRAMAIFMTRHRAAAEDLLQDTIVRILAHQDKFVPGTNFLGWCYRIMRNRHISIGRRRRFQTVPLDHPAALSIQGKAFVESRLVQRELADALRRLPAAQRESILLSVGAGMSYEDIAAATACPVGTVKSRVSRGRATLRRELLDDGDADADGAERRDALAGIATLAASRG